MRLAHQFAMESEVITADMVEATEFPQLSMKYGVRGVPMTVVNERPAITGALTEPVFLAQAMSAVNPDMTG